MNKFTVLLLFWVMPVWGEKNDFALSEKRFRQLSQVQEAFVKNDYDDALERLDSMIKKRNTTYEKAMILRLYADVFIAMDAYPQAISFLQLAWDQKALPEISQLNIQYNLAQLYAQQENYTDSLRLLEGWLLKAQNVTSQVHIFVANMYVQKKNYPKAIFHLREGIKKQSSPKQVWFQQLIALYFEQQKFTEMVAVLKETIQSFPTEKKYWQQLAGIYQKLEKMSDALAILAMAYQQGLLNTEKDVINLANFYLYQELPFQSAQVLTRGLEQGIIEANEKNWSRLVESWVVAKEFDFAIQSLYLARQKEIYDETLTLRLARLLMEKEAWLEVIDVLDASLSTISFSKQSQAYYMMGISAYYANRLNVAKKAFRLANKDKKMRKKLKYWRKVVRF